MAHRYGKKWRGSVTVNGKRYRRLFTEKRFAEKWELQIKKDAEKKLVGISSSKEEIEEAQQHFLAELSVLVKEKTIEGIHHSLQSFLSFCDEKSIHYLDEVKRKHWIEYITHRKNQGKKDTTINQNLQNIKRFLNWCVESRYIGENVFQNLKKIKVNKPDLPVYITVDQLKKCEEYMKGNKKYEYFYPFFFLAVRTGMRSSEISNLKMHHVDMENKKIVLPANMTKSGYSRVIPLNAETVAFIKSLNRKRDGYVVTKDGEKLWRDAALYKMTKLVAEMKKQGVLSKDKKYNVHTLRKTYISNMVMSGVDPQKIMRVVGHGDWGTIKRYLHLAPNYGNDIAESIPY